MGSIAVMTSRLRRIRPRLLAWYDGARRTLPWREDPTPYHVLVSELMLQQTQVDKVVDYYLRFLDRFTDIEALAAASLDDVLRLWSGLGYYSRARHLHRTARLVVEQHAGRIPEDEASLRALPGIGPYTAAAIRSIAFGQAAALVDGNVARVFSRLLLLREAPESPVVRGAIQDAAAILVEGERPSDLNQSLMELGALVCVPVTPRCGECPVSRSCAARKAGCQDEVPRPKQRARRKRLLLAAALARRGSSVLLVRRAERGLFGGLWELPTVEAAPDATRPQLEAALARVVGAALRIERKLSRTERALTHRDLIVESYAVELLEPVKQRPSVRWTARSQLAQTALSSAMRACIEDALRAFRLNRSGA